MQRSLFLPGLKHRGGAADITPACPVFQPFHNSHFHGLCQSDHQTFRLLMPRFWHAGIWCDGSLKPHCYLNTCKLFLHVLLCLFNFCHCLRSHRKTEEDSVSVLCPNPKEQLELTEKGLFGQVRKWVRSSSCCHGSHTHTRTRLHKCSTNSAQCVEYQITLSSVCITQFGEFREEKKIF